MTGRHCAQCRLRYASEGARGWRRRRAGDMATVEAGARSVELIKPVRWWKARPAFGVAEGSRLRDIPDGISRQGPFYVAELKAIAASSTECSEARYAALGYLVALHNSGRV